KFGLPEEMSAPVRTADRILLATEKRDLMAHDPWAWPILEGVEPLSEQIVPWSPEVSMEKFLQRFAELGGAVHAA
ncbi:MAG: HD family hydrolase, partial [Nitrospiraceae bacterium]|nr:HD family hydrolase [Nitrospiraceae bacterium]